MDQNIKQQIVESINGTTNVLVTVSSDPTVDELAACIGLTLVLNKLGKHATAVYSGKTPSTLEFLKPEDTLEDNTDSLRDFIIALDKSKADKLRYKVEDAVVKIFITPYKTSIGQKDLEFSQGDFNVDVVMALGVHKREELDKAIVAHGRILHDATVVCINHDQVSNIGVYNWQDAESSSLCEMVVDLAETMHPDNFDAQTATALLTGIVAETSRFSNEKTTPRTMSLAAKLMAAGANQQLVASKLQTNLTKSQVGLVDEPAEKTEEEKEEEQDSGTLKISHQADEAEKESNAKDKKIAVSEGKDDELLKEQPLEKPLEPKQEKRLEPPTAKLSDAPELPQPAMPQAAQAPVPQPPLTPITDIKSGDSEHQVPNLPSNPAVPGAGGSKLASEPPVMGGTLTAGSQPEPLEPPTDILSGSKDTSAPILSHTPAQLTPEEANSPIIDQETVSHIESSVGSPHVADAAPPPPDVDALAQAAKAAAEENTDGNRLEPLAAAGSQPFDMNVQANQSSPPPLAPLPPAPSPPPPMTPGNTPLPTPSPSASDVMGGMSQTPPGVGLSPAAPLPPPPTGLPPQLVPQDQGPPPEQTASSAPAPLAPPPVPPPFVPGMPPTPTDQGQPPLPPLPPAPGA